MNKEDYQEEVRLTKLMFKKLEGGKFTAWENGRRHIKWDAFGHLYEIEQQLNTLHGDYPRDIVVQTTYWRDDRLHRMDGPAFSYSLGAISKNVYSVNGNDYEFNEFVFFVSGMLEQES